MPGSGCAASGELARRRVMKRKAKCMPPSSPIIACLCVALVRERSHRAEKEEKFRGIARLTHHHPSRKARAHGKPPFFHEISWVARRAHPPHRRKRISLTRVRVSRLLPVLVALNQWPWQQRRIALGARYHPPPVAPGALGKGGKAPWPIPGGAPIEHIVSRAAKTGGPARGAPSAGAARSLVRRALSRPYHRSHALLAGERPSVGRRRARPAKCRVALASCLRSYA